MVALQYHNHYETVRFILKVSDMPFFQNENKAEFLLECVRLSQSSEFVTAGYMAAKSMMVLNSKLWS
jgi:hypothetical protein